MFNSSNFTKDLIISEQIIDKLSIGRTDEELKVFALSLPDLKQPDTYILAGKNFDVSFNQNLSAKN